MELFLHEKPLGDILLKTINDQIKELRAGKVLRVPDLRARLLMITYLIKFSYADVLRLDPEGVPEREYPPQHPRSKQRLVEALLDGMFSDDGQSSSST